MQNYKLISRKGEGTFSEVLKAQSIKTGKYVAIKCMKTHFESIEQVNQLREIQALRKVAPHPHIIKLLEVLFDEPTGRLALVFELMDMNLYELIKDRKTYLPQSRVKHYMYQLFKAVDHIHKKGVFHRDIKPENILISGELIKLADIGSCRGMFGEHPYTEYISTRWYRSPECLMTDGYYDHMMDIWGAGCVMYEILTLDPLFPGKNELDMIHRIHNLLGTPPQEVLDRFKSHASHLDFNFPVKVGTGLDKLIPHVSPDCLDLLKQLLIYDPEKRISASQALKHEYFKELAFAEQQKEFQSTLTSARLSPEFKQFQQSLYIDPEKMTTFHNENHTTKNKDAKKKYKKFPNVKSTSKFPNLKGQFKPEDSFKISHLNDASTEEEENSKEFHMSKLPVINVGAKFAGSPVNSNLKKKDDWSKHTHSHGVFKSTLSHPHLKKLQKPHPLADAPDYLVVGKKAP